MAGGGAGGFESSGGRGSATQDFDLNIAPIIDCFVVLISFLLASAAFISIGILDAGIAAGGAEQANQTPPPIQIVVELKQGGNVVIKTTGKETNSYSIQPAQGTWNYTEVTARLQNIKNKWSTVNAVTLNADNTIEYKEIVQSMEVIRKVMPAVLLGGF